MIRRYSIIGAACVLTAASTVTQWQGWVALLPFHLQAWAVWPLTCAVLLGLLITAQIQNDHERRFAHGDHIARLRDHASVLSKWVSAGQGASNPGAEVLATAFGTHFPPEAAQVEEWNNALREQFAAEDGINGRINEALERLSSTGIVQEQSARALLLQLATNPKSTSEGPEYRRSDGLLVVALHGSPYTVGQPRTEDVWDKWEGAFQEVANQALTWGSERHLVLQRRSALILPLTRNLQAIAEQPEIRRARRCRICGDAKYTKPQ